ncbi:MAG: acetyl-CoA carboxylase biotin carboxyl carrier protein [Spirochaetes bacterium]|jgi:acetyl-CoA carboxylase biotin carboxyl carrier protein|nr:acetyl-CoA carboxylase biotin carboxyl carrier protein [Spirochaetota bacterium]
MELKDLFELVDKFEDSSLTELRIKTEDSSVVLKRGGQDPAPAPAAPQQQPAQPAAVQPQASAQPSHAGGPEVEGGGAGAEDIEYITSPIVATFYRSPAPDAPPFVDEGTRLSTGDTLCVLEAMKVMNELEAEFDLEIVRILVQNGEMVEYGTPIFEVKRL